MVLFDMKFADLETPNYYSKSSGPGRGSVQVHLTSPSGTTSTLLPFRPADVRPASYNSWPLMSVHFWGERPSGSWTLSVAYTGNRGSIKVGFPRVTLYGTTEVPKAVSRIPYMCSSKCDSARSCAASGAEFCDACAKFRLSDDLLCVSSCSKGLTKKNGYCYDKSEQEDSCISPVPTRVAPSSTHTHTPISSTHSEAVPTTTIVPTETGTAEPTSAPKSSHAHPTAEKATALLFMLVPAAIGLWH